MQVVSDTRRRSDVEWFQDAYGDAVQTVRVVASEETRKRRNWVFVTGEQVRGSFAWCETKSGVTQWAQVCCLHCRSLAVEARGFGSGPPVLGEWGYR